MTCPLRRFCRHQRERQSNQSRRVADQGGLPLRLRPSDGEPVWPIEERPVPKGDVPGEWYSPTQPFPTRPPAYARQAVTEDDLMDFTPELRAQALKAIEPFKNGPIFNPPTVSKLGGPLAGLTIGTTNGGTNWPGGGYDPKHIPSLRRRQMPALRQSG